MHQTAFPLNFLPPKGEFLDLDFNVEISTVQLSLGSIMVKSAGYPTFICPKFRFKILAGLTVILAMASDQDKIPGSINSVTTKPKAVSKPIIDRKSTRLNSSHQLISYAVFCL